MFFCRSFTMPVDVGSQEIFRDRFSGRLPTYFLYGWGLMLEKQTNKRKTTHIWSSLKYWIILREVFI